MFGRGKSKQARSKGSNLRLKEDRISQLPDSLICHILSHLPTEIAVRTSVLSARWRSLWLWVPRLELNSRKIPDLTAFLGFGDKFFDSNRVSYIHELKLTIADIRFIDGEDYDSSCFTSWIDAAVKRKVQHLYVRFPPNSCLDVMPLSLYICETLVSLKLQLVALPNAELVSLPCLKILHLNTVWFPNEATFDRLVSSCPVLEELEIEGSVSYKAKVFRVFSTSLRRLTISLRFSLLHSESEIEIDAPRLRFLSIDENLSESFIITNIDSSVKLDLCLRSGMLFERANVLSKSKRLRSFLPQISKFRDMIIHLETFKLLYVYSKLEPLPQFCYMARLQVALYYSQSKWLPIFLQSFPNLKSLTLVCYDDSEERCSEEMNSFSFSHAPQCLLSSLEFVNFKVRIWGLAAEMELIKYFLKNSAILKKLTLPIDYDAIQIQDDFVKKLLKIPRLSMECKVVFL